MNREARLTLFFLLGIVVLLLWMKSDPVEEDDPDVVTVDYRCSMLDQYTFVPDEVITECASRKRILTNGV